MAYPIEIDDAIVLLLGTNVPGLPEDEIRGITRLEKLIFLLEKETKSSDWLTQEADFEPYDFGPFSEKVYQAVDMLAAAELIQDSDFEASDSLDTWEQRDNIGSYNDDNTRDPYTTRNFRLTNLGRSYFNALSAELSQKSLDEISNLKKNFAYLPLRQLIRYVYQQYEEFTTKSLIRDEILGNR